MGEEHQDQHLQHPTGAEPFASPILPPSQSFSLCPLCPSQTSPRPRGHPRGAGSAGQSSPRWEPPCPGGLARSSSVDLQGWMQEFITIGVRAPKLRGGCRLSHPPGSHHLQLHSRFPALQTHLCWTQPVPGSPAPRLQACIPSPEPSQNWRAQRRNHVESRG